MGDKGAKGSTASREAALALAEDLAGLSDAEVTTKAMFGGHGLFGDGVMFAIVDPEGTTFLRTGPDTEPNYEAFGSEPHGRMPYHSIPPNIRGNAGELRTWAAEALALARATKR